MSFISPTLLHVDVPSSTIMGPSIDTEDEEESDDDDDLSANLAEMRCFTQEQRDQGIEYWIVELCRSWYSPDVNNAILERRVAKEARRIFSTQFAGATMLSTLQDLSFFFDFCIRHGWIRQGVETCFHLESLIYEHEISHLPEDERMSLPPLMKGLALTRLLLFRGYYSSGLVVLKRMVSHYNHTYEYATIILARLDNVPLRSFTQENQVKHQDATKRLRTHLHLDPEGRLIFLENILRYLWRFSPESRTHFEVYLKYALAIMPLQSFVALGMECVAEIGLQPFLLGYTKRLNMSRSSIRILFAHRDSSPRASLFPSSPPLSIHTDTHSSSDDSDSDDDDDDDYYFNNAKDTSTMNSRFNTGSPLTPPLSLDDDEDEEDNHEVDNDHTNTRDAICLCDIPDDSETRWLNLTHTLRLDVDDNEEENHNNEDLSESLSAHSSSSSGTEFDLLLLQPPHLENAVIDSCTPSTPSSVWTDRNDECDHEMVEDVKEEEQEVSLYKNEDNLTLSQIWQLQQQQQDHHHHDHDHRVTTSQINHHGGDNDEVEEEMLSESYLCGTTLPSITCVPAVPPFLPMVYNITTSTTTATTTTTILPSILSTSVVSDIQQKLSRRTKFVNKRCIDLPWSSTSTSSSKVSPSSSETITSPSPSPSTLPENDEDRTKSLSPMVKLRIMHTKATSLRGRAPRTKRDPIFAYARLLKIRESKIKTGELSETPLAVKCRNFRLQRMRQNMELYLQQQQQQQHQDK